MFWFFTRPRVTVSGIEDLHLRNVSHIISINDPNAAIPNAVRANNAKTLILRFSDTFENFSSSEAPTMQHLEKVKHFVETESIKCIHIHCRVGTSRSTAVALLVMKLLEPSWSEQQCLLELKRVRRQAAPNPRMIRLIDAMLETQFSLLLEHNQQS